MEMLWVGSQGFFLFAILPDVRVSLAHHLLDTPEEVPEVWMHAKIIVESSVGDIVAIVAGRHHQHVEEVPVLAPFSTAPWRS